jgi:predicted RNase H-like HicB family nuclease
VGKNLRLQVVVEVDEDGKYVAECPALQGCHTQGDTFEEALENIQDVVQMCLEEIEEEQRQLDLRYPEVIALKYIEVPA